MVHLGADVSPENDIQCRALTDQDKQRIAGRKWAEEVIAYAEGEGFGFFEGFVRGIRSRFEERLTPQGAMTELEARVFENKTIDFGIHEGEVYGYVEAEYLAWVVDKFEPLRRYVKSVRFRRRQNEEASS